MSTRSHRMCWMALAALVLAVAPALAAGPTSTLYLALVAKGYPTPKPTPIADCSAMLAATQWTGTVALAYAASAQRTVSGVDYLASVTREVSGTVTLADRTATVDPDTGHVYSVSWSGIDFSGLHVSIDDLSQQTQTAPSVVTTTHSVGGTINPDVSFALLQVNDDCTYSLELWPWADQTQNTVALRDNVFDFLANLAPITVASGISAGVQSPTYCNAQNSSTDYPVYTVNLGTNRTSGGNEIACALLYAQGGSSVAGQLAGSTQVSWQLTPVP